MFGVTGHGSDFKPADETETDIAMGAMAFQAARYGRKLVRCDTELEKYRRRMNAVADAQAVRMGANPEDLQRPVEDDSMNVYTNSPVTHHYPAQRNQVLHVMGAWMLAMLGTAMLIALLLGTAWFLVNYLPAPNQNPTPNPVEPPPIEAEGDLHIQIIPAESEE